MNRERGEKGDVRIENDDRVKHIVHVRVSEPVPSTQTDTKAMMADSDLNFRTDERYTVSPNSVMKVRTVGGSEESGHVKVIAELEDGATIERWIEIPTQYVWTIDIASDGELTWKWVGIE